MYVGFNTGEVHLTAFIKRIFDIIIIIIKKSVTSVYYSEPT